MSNIMDNTPIFVINLDRRPDRMEKTKIQLEKFTNNYTRFSAVDITVCKINVFSSGVNVGFSAVVPLTTR